jgi:hypothetical protein
MSVENDDLLAALQAAEWGNRNREGEPMCPVCNGYENGFELVNFMVYHPGENRGPRFRKYPHRPGTKEDHTIILDGHAFDCALGKALGHIKEDSPWEFELPTIEEFFGK